MSRIPFGFLRLFHTVCGSAVDDLFDAVHREKILTCQLAGGGTASVLLTDGEIALGIFLLCAVLNSPLGFIGLCGDIDKIAVYVFLYLFYKLWRQNIPCVLVRHFCSPLVIHIIPSRKAVSFPREPYNSRITAKK